jgi:hypothetical protein
MKLKIGQRIDLYNVLEGHHVYAPNQTLIDNHNYTTPDLMFGIFINHSGLRSDTGMSCLIGIDVKKVGTFIIKSIKS